MFGIPKRSELEPDRGVVTRVVAAGARMGPRFFNRGQGKSSSSTASMARVFIRHVRE